MILNYHGKYFSLYRLQYEDLLMSTFISFTLKVTGKILVQKKMSYKVISSEFGQGVTEDSDEDYLAEVIGSAQK